MQAYSITSFIGDVGFLPRDARSTERGIATLKPISQLRFDCDTTTTRLRRKIDILRRSRIVVVSQSNRNFDHFRRSRMRRGIVVYDV